jgi:hypothetical protein
MLQKLRDQGIKIVASLNTRISRLGWGVSWLVRDYDMVHYEFYPQTGDGSAPFYQRMSRALGGILVPLKGTHQNAFRVMAKRWLSKHGVKAYVLPVGLADPDVVYENSELVMRLPSDLFEGTVVIPSSSGVIAAGIIYGMARRKSSGKAIAVFSSRFTNRREKILLYLAETERKYRKLGGLHSIRFDVVVLDRPYGKRETCYTPFPCDVYLDRAPWRWLVENAGRLREPITFWNIGGEWDPMSGLVGKLRGDGLVTPSEVVKFLESSGAVA